MSPLSAVARVALLGSSAVAPRQRQELDEADLMAALSLVYLARADLDALELSLHQIARSAGFTWHQIAFGLGLGSAQAARQRNERLAAGRPARGR